MKANNQLTNDDLEDTYIASIDPYVQDESSEGSSLGTVYTYKDNTNITNGENNG